MTATKTPDDIDIDIDEPRVSSQLEDNLGRVDVHDAPGDSGNPVVVTTRDSTVALTDPSRS